MSKILNTDDFDPEAYVHSEMEDGSIKEVWDTLDRLNELADTSTGEYKLHLLDLAARIEETLLEYGYC